MEPIDKVGAVGADRVEGLSQFRVMKNDPVWSQLAPEVAALQTLAISLKTQFNALLAKLDTNHAAATDHVATLAVTAADPAL
jgi:hypothetical protein